MLYVYTIHQMGFEPMQLTPPGPKPGSLDLSDIDAFLPGMGIEPMT